MTESDERYPAPIFQGLHGNPHAVPIATGNRNSRTAQIGDRGRPAGLAKITRMIIGMGHQREAGALQIIGMKSRAAEHIAKFRIAAALGIRIATMNGAFIITEDNFRRLEQLEHLGPHYGGRIAARRDTRVHSRLRPITAHHDVADTDDAIGGWLFDDGSLFGQSIRHRFGICIDRRSRHHRLYGLGRRFGLCGRRCFGRSRQGNGRGNGLGTRTQTSADCQYNRHQGRGPRSLHYPPFRVRENR